MINNSPPSYTSFNGHIQIASGSLQANALAVKQAMLSGAQEALLVFSDQTGRVIDIDTRGSDAEIVARLQAEQDTPPAITQTEIAPETASEPRSRGRPKLGVVAREVTLLARHWEWLATQEGGASVTLRKLVEEARRANTELDQQRQACERTYQFMSAMAGDLAGFEEASRALFANDTTKFQQQIENWPKDIRNYLCVLACGSTATPPSSEDTK